MWIACGVVLFLIALFVSLNGGFGSGVAKPGVDQKVPDASGVSSGAVAGPEPSSGGSERVRTKGDGNRRTGSDPEKGPRFPLVDAVLEDESLTNQQSALKLREIVLTEAAPENERLEALAHGLNLDFMAFKGIASAVTLPESVAERYLSELTNQNEHRSEQVEGLMDLMVHPSESVRTDSVDRLAFLIENEELASSPERLKVAAREFLERMKQAPAPEPAPSEPEGGNAGTSEPSR